MSGPRRSHNPKAPAHGPFAAHFPGWCFQCERPIDPGDTIERDGQRYAHVACLRIELENRPIARRDLPAPLERSQEVRWVDLLGREHVPSPQTRLDPDEIDNVGTGQLASEPATDDTRRTNAVV